MELGSALDTKKEIHPINMMKNGDPWVMKIDFKQCLGDR